MTARSLASVAGALLLLTVPQPAPAQFLLPIPDPHTDADARNSVDIAEPDVASTPAPADTPPAVDTPSLVDTPDPVDTPPPLDAADPVAVPAPPPEDSYSAAAAPVDAPAPMAHENGDDSAEPVPAAVATTDLAATHELTGLASWYGGKFNGRLTANGEVFDTNQLTAAHKTLPFGTIVRVTNDTNEKFVIVRINDRGPFVEGRVIDLSRAAADIIGAASAGVAPVTLDIIHLQEESNLRTIQVASFSMRENADDLVVELGSYGIPAVIETVADRGLHRVVIQGVNESEISDVRSRLAAVGFSNVLVRRK